MKCIILAAGYATRLYPLTQNFPKPLLEIGNKTIIDWLIDDIKTANTVDEFIVVSNHKFVKHFNDWAKDKKNVTILDDGTDSNDNRLGAVKDIEFAIERCNIDDDVMVLAGDNVLDFSLCRFIDYFNNKHKTCVMRYYEEDKAKISKSGCLVIDTADKVHEMMEKPKAPKSNWCCPPFYIYSKEDAKKINKAIDEGAGFDAPGSFIAWLCKMADVYAFEMPGHRYDIGNLESYERVKAEYRGMLSGK